VNPHKRWTQTDITELRQRVNDGQGTRAIADAIGRSEDDVRTMIGRLRLVQSGDPRLLAG
jgi:hypothetical protein